MLSPIWLSFLEIDGYVSSGVDYYIYRAKPGNVKVHNRRPILLDINASVSLISPIFLGNVPSTCITKMWFDELHDGRITKLLKE